MESYSFTSLAEALLRRYGGAAVPTLTEAGRALLLRRATDSLLDKVVYYNRQRRSAAFCEKAAQTINELKSAGVTPEMLAQYANAPALTAKTQRTGADLQRLRGAAGPERHGSRRPPAARRRAVGRSFFRGLRGLHRRV